MAEEASPQKKKEKRSLCNMNRVQVILASIFNDYLTSLHHS